MSTITVNPKYTFTEEVKQPVSMKPRRVLITSPSLNVSDNVSGISSLVADIMNFSKFKFVHLQLGSKDQKKKKNLILRRV